MECQYGKNDCKFLNEKCDRCINGYHYSSKNKEKTVINKKAKPDKRMGSSFEYRNHIENEAIFSKTTSKMTKNSGAGEVKGDEQIRGHVRAMEELKTRVVIQAKGEETFTIRKEWLIKLNSDAKKAKEEFWYLKFSFYEFDEQVYIIVEKDVIMSMIVTMDNDRESKKQIELSLDSIKKQLRSKELEIIALNSKIEFLESKIKELEYKEKRSL